MPPGGCATVAGGVNWQQESFAFEFSGGGAGEAAAFEREYSMGDVSGDGVGPEWQGTYTGNVLFEGNLGEAARVSPGAGKIDVVNSSHAVGGNEGNALSKQVEGGFESKDGSGSQLIGSELPGCVHPVAMGFKAGEELKPSDARHIVVRKSPLVVGNVIPDLVESVLVQTEGVATFRNGLNADDPGV